MGYYDHMIKGAKMVYEICVDMDGSSDYMSALEPWINRGLKIAHYVHVGPGGGNPCVTFETQDRALAVQFLEFYNPDEELEDLFDLHVREK
jgi:hypothetical protein